MTKADWYHQERLRPENKWDTKRRRKLWAGNGRNRAILCELGVCGAGLNTLLTSQCQKASVSGCQFLLSPFFFCLFALTRAKFCAKQIIK